MSFEKSSVTYLSSDDEVIPGGKIGVNYETNELLFANEGFCSLTGYSVSELKEKSTEWAKLFLHPADSEELRNSLSDLYTKPRAQGQTRIVCKTGAIVWADVFAGVVKNEKYGKHAAITFIDNTKKYEEIKNAEGMRREMDAIIANLPGGVAKVMINSDFSIVFASDGFYELTGYTREEYHDFPIFGRGSYLILPEDFEKLGRRIEKQMQSGEQLFVEYRIKQKSGDIVWIEAHGSPVDIQNGVPVAQVIFTDTTAIKSGTRKLLGLTNNIPGGVAHLKLDGDRLSVEYASDGFYKLVGYTKEEFGSLGMRLNCAPLFSPRDWKLLLRAIKAFFESGRTNFEYECRIRNRDDDVRWLNVHGRLSDEQCHSCELECVITDVTEMHHSREALRQSEMRYRFISEQMNEVVFEWDIKTGSVVHSPTFEKRFGYKIREDNTIHFMKKSDIVHEDEQRSFFRVIEEIEGGAEYSEADVRVRHISGKYLWCAIRVVNVFDDEGKPEKAFGIIFDIEDFKRKTEELEERAERDPLTGVLNKTVACERISEYLSLHLNDRESALFAIDLDVFKGINDTYGHAMGDAVLIALTERVRALVRSSDIIGRIGGDEFLVYIANGMSERSAAERAKSFVAAMGAPVGRKGVQCSANISVGYALCPKDGQTFDELFEKADKALYKAKQAGRNRAERYV